MELRHLRYFVTLAEELHFGRAAQKLHIAQPPLSQQIRQLEVELGFDLFYRTKRSVELTTAGSVFLQEVQQIFKLLDTAIQSGKKASRGELGKLVIGFVSSAAYNILPLALRSHRECFADVSLELREMTTSEQLQQLQTGTIDVGFLRPPITSEDLDLEIIYQESLIVALPENHRFADRETISLATLAQEQFIFFPRSLAPGLYDLILDLCLQAGFQPNLSQEAAQMQTIVSLVAGKIGVAIVPESLQNLQRTGVVYRMLTEQTPKIAIALTWRKHDKSPTLQRFIDIVIQATSDKQY